ncbi:DUF6301 family protein [Nocardia brasiliensis]|uniref:DUF6301 family protein n=1 Tax=Nocardia brasiliensis TaxID=37326 RepID=UPI003F98AC48
MRPCDCRPARSTPGRSAVAVPVSRTRRAARSRSWPRGARSHPSRPATVVRQIMDGKIDQVAVHLSDVAATPSRQYLAGAFADAAVSLDVLLGRPLLRATEPDSKVFWHAPQFIGVLLLLDIGLVASVFRWDSWGVIDELRARGLQIER